MTYIHQVDGAVSSSSISAGVGSSGNVGLLWCWCCVWFSIGLRTNYSFFSQIRVYILSTQEDSVFNRIPYRAVYADSILIFSKSQCVRSKDDMSCQNLLQVIVHLPKLAIEPWFQALSTASWCCFLPKDVAIYLGLYISQLYGSPTPLVHVYCNDIIDKIWNK